MLKLAIKNLFRNRWRTALTLGGIAVAVALMVWSHCLMDGMRAQMIAGATGVNLGQAQIHTSGYIERPSIYEHFADEGELFSQLESLSGVKGVAPRVHVFGLIGHETESVVAAISGINPVREAQVTSIHEGIVEGRWLSDVPQPSTEPREVVLGKMLADQLSVSPGDELVLFASAADGSLGNELLVVSGVFRSGNSVLDRTGVMMHIADVQYFAALDGRFHEIAVGSDDFENAGSLVEAINGFLSLEENELVARSWQQLAPEVGNMLEMNDAGTWFMYFFIYIIVALGIVNTQRMSTLERYREFGVLLALGLRQGSLGFMIFLETMLLTLLGAAIGVAVGGYLGFHHSQVGLDLNLISDGATGFSIMGVTFSDRLLFVFSMEAVFKPVVVVILTATVASLWPVISSMRIDARTAISGRK